MLLIFDMDGTVLDSMDALTSAARSIISRTYGLSNMEARDAYLRTVGRPFREQLQILFPDDVRNGDAVKHYEAVHEELGPTFPLGPGVADLIRDLRLSGHDAVLVTSTSYRYLLNMPQVTSLPWTSIHGFVEGFPKDAQLRWVIKSHAYAGPAIMFGDTEFDRRIAMANGIEFFPVHINLTTTVVRNALRR